MDLQNTVCLKADKKERGTEIILHIDKDSKNFLKKAAIELLTKYNKFMPVPIKFGTKEETLPLPEGELKMQNLRKQLTISSTTPTRLGQKPADLKKRIKANSTKNYTNMQFEEPLFNIHLNVDYPF